MSHVLLPRTNQSELSGVGIQNTGSGDVHVEGNVTISRTSFGMDFSCYIVKNSRLIIQEYEQCIVDLRVTDPRHDKKRIEDTKGGLLKDSYAWVLDNPDFRQWCDGENTRLLWVKGDPGKGKTMLLCGIIDQLRTESDNGRLLSYFFCQATDKRINTATAVLRGLIYMLLDQNASLVSHLEKKYETSGKTLFEDVNAWQALSEIFINMLHDPELQGVRFVVDALDECLTDLPRLLDLIVQTSESTKALWLISSRNWLQIEERLSIVSQKLSLELNQSSVSKAVDKYITLKVAGLAVRKRYKSETRDKVCCYLSEHAAGTFLWVALVCKELDRAHHWNALERIKTFPSGLDSLYLRMVQQIYISEDAELCKRILGLVTTTYRPLSLAELTTFIEECQGMTDDVESLQDIISLCGSFLCIRENIIYFVHQSAKDFLIEKQSSTLFTQGRERVHGQIFTRSVEVMSQMLKRDIYQLRDPGFHIKNVSRPAPDPLATVAYSCIYWAEHLLNSGKLTNENKEVKNGGTIDTFFQSKFLCWIESLSLLRHVSRGILSLERLIKYLKVSICNSSNYILYH